MNPEYSEEAILQQQYEQQQQQEAAAAAELRRREQGLLASMHAPPRRPTQHSPTSPTPAQTPPSDDLQAQMAQLLVALGQRTIQPKPERSEKTPDVQELALSSATTTAPAEIDLFERRLALKFRINNDRFTTPTSRVNYAFSRISGHAAESLMTVLDGFSDWQMLIAYLRQLYGHPDPDWYYHQRFISLKQANRPFLEFLADFRFLAQKAPGASDPAFLKQQLRFAISRELTEKLNTVDTRPLSFEQLAAECARLSSLMTVAGPASRSTPRSAAPNTKAPAPAPRVAVVPAVPAAPVAPAAASVPTIAGSDPMDLDTKRRIRREQGLCFYCGSGDHKIGGCSLAPARRASARAESLASSSRPSPRPSPPALAPVGAPSPSLAGDQSPASDCEQSENGVSLA